MNKEAIYDEQIDPLMAQIIAICREHKIPVVAVFHTPNEDDQDLFCATRSPDENGKFPGYMAELSFVVTRAIKGGGNPLMMTVEHGDGSKTMTAIIP